MHPTKAAAHLAGWLYVVLMITGIVGEFVIRDFLVPGDPAATASGILAAQRYYRLDLMLGLVSLVVFILVVGALYRLFREVDRVATTFMVLLASMGIATAFANLLIRFLPLVLLGNADALTAIPRPQLEALVLVALHWHGAGSAVPLMFWGLWLFPFGRLVIRSGWFPRLLGYLLMAAGIGYVIGSCTAILFPEQRALMSRLLMPLYFGEVPIILWLALRGARVRGGEAAV